MALVRDVFSRQTSMSPRSTAYLLYERCPFPHQTPHVRGEVFTCALDLDLLRFFYSVADKTRTYNRRRRLPRKSAPFRRDEGDQAAWNSSNLSAK